MIGIGIDLASLSRDVVFHDLRTSMPSGSTYTRTGATATELNVAVELLPFAANVPQRTDRGLALEPARTNKIYSYNANPPDLSGTIKGGDAAAVLSLVDDTAALAAAGLSGVVTGGMVYCLDNTAGVASAFFRVFGSTGNTNPHKYSAYMRVVGSGGSVGVSATSSANVACSTGAYQRTTATRATPTASEDIRLNVNAGAVGYVILPETVEASVVTSPIITVGAAATRDLPVFTEQVPAGRTAALLTYADATTTLVTGLTPGGTLDVATAVIGASKGAFNASELVSRTWQA